jgi:hypothetical protein
MLASDIVEAQWVAERRGLERTMEQLDDLLAGIDVTLSDDILDRIDEIVPPGTDVGLPGQSACLLRPSSTPTSADAPPANAPQPDRTPRDASVALSGGTGS